MIKKISYSFIAFLFSFNSFAALPTQGEYTTDIPDFYVGGNPLNDSLNMVNLVLCYIKNTRPESYINLPPATPNYLAIIYEDECNAGGKDSSGDSSAMQATSSSGKSGGGSGGSNNNNNTEVKTKLKSRVVANITQAATVDAEDKMPLVGKTWVTLKADPTCSTNPDCSGFPFDALIYQKMTQTASPSPVSKFGDFELNYSLYSDPGKGSNAIGSILAAGAGPPTGAGGGVSLGSNTSITGKANISYAVPNSQSYTSHEQEFQGSSFALGHGYVKGSGNSLLFKEAFFGSFSDLYINFTDTGSRGVYTREAFGNSGPVTAYYAFDVNETEKRFCNKLLTAYQLSWDSMYSSDSGFEGGKEPAQTEMTTTEVTNAGLPTTEQCFSTNDADAKRDVWRYGIYHGTEATSPNSEGDRLELTGGSFPIRAENPSAGGDDLFGWADYWGIWVDYDSRTGAESATWNRDDGVAGGPYSLAKTYLETTQITNTYNSLDSIHKIKINFWIDYYEGAWGWKTNWNTLLGNTCDTTKVNDANDTTCYNEYEGYWDKDLGSFVLTHGLKWGGNYNSDPRTELSTPITISASAWTTNMKKSADDTYTLWTWSPETGNGYQITHASILAPTSANSTAGLKSEKWDRVDVATLNGKTFRCIIDCITPSAMNTRIQEVATLMGDGNDANNPQSNTPLASIFDANSTSWFTESGNWVSVPGIATSLTTTYTVDSGKLYAGSVATNNEFNINATSQTAIANAKTASGLDDWGIFGNAYVKTASYHATSNTWATRGMNWGLRNGYMVETGSTAETELVCANDGNSPPTYDQYDNHPRYNDAVDNEVRFCEQNIWEGKVSQYYEFSIRTEGTYQLIDSGNVVIFEQPKKLVLDTSLFSPSQITESGLASGDQGKSYNLTFEGFGNLWGIPGEVYDTCAGVGLGEYYYGSWNDCHRWAAKFTIPEGAALSELADSNKVYYAKPLNGDKYLATKTAPGDDSLYAGLSLTDTGAATLIKDMGPGGNTTDKIGELPAEATYINSGNPAVIHGKIIQAAP